MLNRASSGALFALFVASLATQAAAIDGEVLITHPKAVAGGITPGDDPGYPVTISLPGSYKFAGNLTVPPSTNGITVTSDDVTIDFAGFRLWSAGAAFHGITGTGNSLTIKNGTITNFGGRGIWGAGDFWSIDNMRIALSAQQGIFAQGDSWTIANSQIVENGRHGIYAEGANFLVRNNVVNGNGQVGINALLGAHVEANLVAENGLIGTLSPGISMTKGMVLGNTITDNGYFGLTAAINVGYGNNTLSGNNGAGAEVNGGFQLHPNVCNNAAC